MTIVLKPVKSNKPFVSEPSFKNKPPLVSHFFRRQHGNAQGNRVLLRQVTKFFYFILTNICFILTIFKTRSLVTIDLKRGT